MALGALVGAALAARRRSRRKHWPNFQGRVVAITGGTRGLGLALAREFARRGARLAICGRSGITLEEARRDLEQRGAAVLALNYDVADGRSATEFVREVQRHFGIVDVLINNAGLLNVGPVESMNWDDFDLAMRIHYWAPLNTTLAVLPSMRARRNGRIVNIASIGGLISVPHLLPYGPSKAALIGLSEGLRAELAKDGIWVTTVCPGLIRTGSPRHAQFKGRHRLEYAWFKLVDLLPIITMSPERAARRIVEACRRGDAELILTWPARVAAGLHGLAPGLMVEALSFVDRLMPSFIEGGQKGHRGVDSESALTRRFGARAERTHLQL